MNNAPEQRNNALKPIDLRKVLESKNPKLSRWIPDFALNRLKKIVCLDDINDFIARYGERKGIDFANAVMEYLRLSLNVRNPENLPLAGGRYLFVSNHPFGGPDGIALISYLGAKYPQLKFPVNDILLNLHNLNDIFLPVNKHGKQSKEAVQAIDEAYSSDCQMIMFPAGLCSRKHKGIVRDLEWKKNFITQAVKHRRDVVPIHIGGANSNFFYNLSNFRKKIGLKANIEMLWLPKEAYKKKNSIITLTIGTPVSWQTFDKSKTPQEWAAEMKELLYTYGK